MTLRHCWPPRLLPLLLACLLLPARADELGGIEAEADKDLKELGKDLGVDVSGRTKFVLVRAEAPDQPITPALFWRELPDYTAANSYPAEVRIGGDAAIAARQEVLPNDLGMVTIWEPFGALKLPPGEMTMKPGRIRFRNEDGQLTCKHPAIVVKSNSEVRIRCAAVRFSTVDSAGAPVPFNLSLSDGEVSLLRKPGPYNPLIMWLPVGLQYESSFGTFSLDNDGKIVSATPRNGAVQVPDGFRVTLAPAAKAASAAPATADKLYLWTYRQRRVYAQGESAACFVLVPQGFAGGEATVTVGGRAHGTLTLPAVPERSWDARGFTLAIGDLPPGEHSLAVRAGAAASDALTLTIVPNLRRTSPFMVHTMSGCAESPPKTPEGLALLRDAGLEMATDAGSLGTISTAMPRLVAPPPGLPAELGWKRTDTDENLEEFLRQRMGYIDLIVCRAGGLYMEGLSYHHSYPPSVERMVRHMSVFATQTADYPSWWGPNYAWFPKPGGYAEGGVPCDGHVHERNLAVNKRLAAAGFASPTAEETKWYQAHKFSKDPAERTKALDILARTIKHWQMYNQFSFGEHNALYNAAIRQVRPDAVCTLFDNAGHDTGNRARDQFNDMAASCYESYTDYGEWPMSAGFTTDWALGSNPGKPAWITVDWGSTSDGMMKSLFHAFARGLPGGGCPMPASGGAELVRRAKGFRLLAQYGSLATRTVPDRRTAILATLSQRMFDGRTSYACHAIYYHLTRLGYPAIVVDEEDALKTGIPPGVKALFIVRQEQPLSPETLAVLKRFQDGGGKIFATGDSTVELAGVTKVGGEVKDIWRLSGFEWQSHADMWREFREVWREPLSKALAAAALPALATTDPERGLVLGMDAGPVRYLVVNADTAGTHYTVFNVTENLPVSVEGAGWQVRDLVWQRDVPAQPAAGRTDFSVSLETEPTKLLALYKSPPAAVELQQSGRAAFRAKVTAADKSDLGAVPLAYTITAPDGQVRDTLHRPAGEEFEFPIPAQDKPGAWTVKVQELLTGITSTLTWTPVPPAAATTVAALPDVHIVDERQLRDFAAAKGERLIIVEANQSALLPVAEKLAQKLTAAGVAARVWQVQPEDFDSIPVRWYPRAEDQVRLTAVEDGKLIGYRQNLKPYIDKKKAAHLPERGGYAEIDPPWMVGKHAILFSGGRLAESLRAVTAWLPTPNIPGTGQGRIVVCFSPFLADRHVAVLAANDAVGFGKAAERLAQFFPAQGVAGRAMPAKPAFAAVAAKPGKEPVATPFTEFTPRRRVQHLLALRDGRAALHLQGDRDNLAFVSAEGKITQTCRVPGGTEMSFTATGDVWSYWLADGTVHGIGVGPDGQAKRSFDLPLNPAGMLPPNRSPVASFPVTPDGKWLVASRFGGIQFADLDKNAWRFYDDLPHVWHRYEVWTPRFPIGMTFSPDGRYLFCTMDTRPTGFTNMSGDAFTPTGFETLLLDVSTGARVWSKRAANDPNPNHYYAFVGLDSVAYATHSGFAAVARDGAVTALTDYVGEIMLIGKDGKEILNQQAVANVPMRRQYDWGPPGGVGTWISDRGDLAMFGFRDQLVLAVGAKTATVKIAGLVSGAVTPDGTLAVAGFEAGDVIAYGPDGQEHWRFQTGGIVPALASVAPDHTLIATNRGELIRLDGKGKEVWRAACGAAVDRARHAVDAAKAPALPRPAEYRVPQTLAVAKSLLKAQPLAQWTPAGEAETYAGLTFHRTQPGIKLEGAAPEAFVHLVYRRPAESKRLAVRTSGGDGQEVFELDLPTPEYRVIDIPVHGPQVSVEIIGDGPVAVAECSLWSYSWPGPNVAYVQEATPGSGKEMSTETNAKDKDEIGGLGDDLADLDKDGRSLAGKLKDTAIFIWNGDPDKVQGVYFPARYSPLVVVDGKRFGNGRLGGWPRGKDQIGPWFTEMFPYPVALRVTATYDCANRQSQVVNTVSVFANGDPAERDSGRVIGGAIGNDQFWRVFPAGDVKAKRLGAHVRGGSNGLSELEAYPPPK